MPSDLQRMRDGYVNRMKSCPQFAHFGITPEWFPGKGDVEGFIHDEVVRQYHDTRVRSDGGVRIEWMQSAWDYARRNADVLPQVNDILALGTLIEPEINHVAFRTENVYIGSGIGAPPRLLNKMVTALVARAPHVEPRIKRTGPHPNEYRALWQWDILSDSDVLRQYAELLTGVVTADDWYLAYEAIHPFGDGNGRSGKVLHNWFLHTLDEPVLVADYFGGGNP